MTATEHFPVPRKLRPHELERVTVRIHPKTMRHVRLIAGDRKARKLAGPGSIQAIMQEAMDEWLRRQDPLE